MTFIPVLPFSLNGLNERQILHVNLNTVKHILILARTMQYLVI